MVCLKFLVDFSLLVHISLLNCGVQAVVTGTFFWGRFGTVITFSPHHVFIFSLLQCAGPWQLIHHASLSTNMDWDIESNNRVE